MSFADESNSCVNNPVNTGLDDEIETITKDCSPEAFANEKGSANAPLRKSFEVKTDRLCTCLDEAKFN
jgi:hypothetical protein